MRPNLVPRISSVQVEEPVFPLSVIDAAPQAVVLAEQNEMVFFDEVRVMGEEPVDLKQFTAIQGLYIESNSGIWSEVECCGWT